MNLNELIVKLADARRELQKVIVGEDELIDYTFMCFFSVGRNASPHELIVGKTGTAKTTLVKYLGPIFGLETNRVDGNGEPSPYDLIGGIDLRSGEFVKGPIFTNLLLLDEINRLNPRTRSALLSPMAEGIVTVAGVQYELPDPFIVVATQNPASYGDSAPLRIQENDRFILSCFTGWPEKEAQAEIIGLNIVAPSQEPKVQRIFSAQEIIEGRELIAESVMVSQSIKEYAVELTRQLLPSETGVTRVKDVVRDTAISRGGRDLVIVARTKAAFSGESHVLPEHIDEVALNVLSHRIDRKSTSKELSSRQVRELLEEVIAATRKKASSR